VRDLLQYFNTKKKNSAGVLQNWRNWAYRILFRRHVVIEPTICAYDKDHLVGRVQPFGGGSIFWSQACNGCQLGELLIGYYKTFKKVPQSSHCALLLSGLLTKDQVKPGQVYHLPARYLE